MWNKVKILDERGQQVDAIKIPVKESTERFGEIHLEDGSVLHIKATVLSVARFENRWDDQGNPAYQVQSQTIVSVHHAPEQVRRQGGLVMVPQIYPVHSVSTSRGRPWFANTVPGKDCWHGIPVYERQEEIPVLTDKPKGHVISFPSKKAQTQALTPADAIVTSYGTRFCELVQQWHQERGGTSSISEMVACPSYQSIIGMGQAALPLIFDQLCRERTDPDHWHAALVAITGQNPVTNEAYGDLVAIANAWLSWARKTGYLH